MTLACVTVGVGAPTIALAQLPPVNTPSTPSIPPVNTPPVNTSPAPKPPSNTPPATGGGSTPSTPNTPSAPSSPSTPSSPSASLPSAGGGGVDTPGVTVGGGGVTVGSGGGGAAGGSATGTGVSVSPSGAQVGSGTASTPNVTATGNGPKAVGGNVVIGDGSVKTPTVSAGGSGTQVGPGGVSLGDGSVGALSGALTGSGNGGRILPDGTIITPGGGLTGGGPGGITVITPPGSVNPVGGGGGGVHPPTVGVGGGGGSPVTLPLGTNLIPGAGGVRTVIGGIPLTPGSLGVRPTLGLFLDNPQFAIGGSAGMIAADTPNALRPAALGAYRLPASQNPGALALEGANARPGVDFPAGVLGIDPGRALAIATAEGTTIGLLTPARLIAQQLPASDGGSNVFTDVTDAIDAVLKHLPDWSRPIIAGLLVLLLLSGIRAMFASRRTRKLERARKALTADVAVLQAALVPDLPEHINGLDLSVAYRPADGLASGGDFYDAFALDESRVGIILGDVSGHDRRAIARASAIRHKLRAYLELGLEPRMVLRAAGEALSTDSFDGDFATAAVAVHDASEGTLTYACAGHPAPVIIGAGSHDPVVTCSSPALGWGLPTGRRQTTLVLGDGDILCFFTDGLVEARSAGDFLGRDGLERFVGELDGAGTARDLLDKVIDYTHEVDDDLAALVLRAGTPVIPRALRVEELEIGAHDVRRKTPERFLAACDAPVETIEQLGTTAAAAVEESGRAVLQVRFDPDAGDVEASVVTLPQLSAPRRAVLVH